MNWSALSLIASLQAHLGRLGAIDYKRTQVNDDHHYIQVMVPDSEKNDFWDIPYPLEFSSVKFNTIKMEEFASFYEKKLTESRDIIYIYSIRIGISHKTRTVFWYTNKPLIWGTNER